MCFATHQHDDYSGHYRISIFQQVVSIKTWCVFDNSSENIWLHNILHYGFLLTELALWYWNTDSITLQYFYHTAANIFFFHPISSSCVSVNFADTHLWIFYRKPSPKASFHKIDTTIKSQWNNGESILSRKKAFRVNSSTALIWSLCHQSNKTNNQAEVSNWIFVVQNEEMFRRQRTRKFRR